MSLDRPFEDGELIGKTVLPDDLRPRLASATGTRSPVTPRLLSSHFKIGQSADLAADPVLSDGVTLRRVTARSDLQRIAAKESTVWGEDWSWLADDLAARIESAPENTIVLVGEARTEVVRAAWLVFKDGVNFGGSSGNFLPREPQRALADAGPRALGAVRYTGPMTRDDLSGNEGEPVPLAPYRLVWLALWAEATPQEEPKLTEHLHTALAPHGTVVVHARGPFHRTPEMLHFEIDLTPDGSAPDCMRALGFTWNDDSTWNNEWERPVCGGVFLHPAVYGAQAGEMEAAAPPRFETGDVVLVRDSDATRLLGLADAEVTVGHPEYDHDTDPARRTWYYSVRVEGQDESEYVDEADIEPTGRNVQVYRERISVNTNGVLMPPSDQFDE